MTDPYYSDELVTLYLGDCLDVVPTLGLFDLVFTSPPYNLGTGTWAHLGNWKPTDGRGTSKWDNGSKGGGGIVYDEHDDTMPWDEYVAWQQHVLTVLWAHLTEDGAIFYNHKPRLVGGHLWTPMELLPTCVSLRQIVVWARAGTTRTTTDRPHQWETLQPTGPTTTWSAAICGRKQVPENRAGLPPQDAAVRPRDTATSTNRRQP